MAKTIYWSEMSKAFVITTDDVGDVEYLMGEAYDRVSSFNDMTLRDLDNFDISAIREDLKVMDECGRAILESRADSTKEENNEEH